MSLSQELENLLKNETLRNSLQAESFQEFVDLKKQITDLEKTKERYYQSYSEEVDKVSKLEKELRQWELRDIELKEYEKVLTEQEVKLARDRAELKYAQQRGDEMFSIVEMALRNPKVRYQETRNDNINHPGTDGNGYVYCQTTNNSSTITKQEEVE